MKKYVVLLLIGLMFLGLTLSVLAAEPDTSKIKSGDAVSVSGTTARAPAQEDLKKQAISEPLAAKLAVAVNHNRAAMSLLRKLIWGVCGFVMMCTQLGFAFSRAGSQTKNAVHIMAVNIVVCSIGMLDYRIRLFLTRLLIPKREREVCYG